MKKALKIAAAVTAILLIAALLLLYRFFCGDIFSKLYAKAQIDKYVQQHYPGTGYVIDEPEYQAFDACYQCLITDPDSEDGWFMVNYHSGGTITDTYEDIAGLEHTIWRLDYHFNEEMQPLVSAFLKEDAGEFCTATVTDTGYIDRSRLYVDMAFDAKHMPMDTYVMVHFNERASAAECLERMQTMAKHLRALGYRIDYYSFWEYRRVPTDKLLSASDDTMLHEYKAEDAKEPDIHQTP